MLDKKELNLEDISSHIAHPFEIVPISVARARPSWIARTTSDKPMRNATLQRYELTKEARV